MSRGDVAAQFARRVLPHARSGAQPLTELSLNLRLARALIGAGRAAEAQSLLARASTVAEPLYEHSPQRITLNWTQARYLAALGDKRGALEHITRARKSLAVEHALGPHIQRAVAAAETEVHRTR